MMGAPPSPRRAARGARTWCLAGLAAIATGCVATEHVEPRDPFEVLSTADVPDGTTVAAVDLEPTGAGTMTAACSSTSDSHHHDLPDIGLHRRDPGIEYG